MRCPRHFCQIAIGLAVLLASSALADEGSELFEKRIRPVLVRHCYECHSSAAKEPKGGLRLDTRPGVDKGGDSGPALVRGKPEESLLLEALRHESIKMPPDKKLSDEVIADFHRWVELGAPDPRDSRGDSDKAGELAWEAAYQERLDWWSLQPLVAPSIPDVRHAGWGVNRIDRFILAKLEAHGIGPSPQADRRTLVRRLSFALTGLPPSAAELTRALSDEGPEWWTQCVDRFLASPHFGERWARHWMDVVRYSDTYGYEWDVPAKGAWRYRDYMIRAFNSDLPYDQFVREQIAGDLLERPRVNPVEQLDESRIGPMFYQLGEKRHGDSSEFNGIHQEMLDNKVDAFSKAFQAVTVSCARCHDHKLDAVSQKDYYALSGIFMSSRWVTNTVDTPDRHAAIADELRAIKTSLRPVLARVWLEEAGKLPETLVALAVAEPGNVGLDEQRLAALKKLFDPPADAPLPLESPATVWTRLVRAHREQKSIAGTWKELAKQYADEYKSRSERNARDFLPIADFSQGVPAGWSADGIGLRDRVPCGDFTVSASGPQVVGRVLPGGLFTHALSPRMNGALRTPYLNSFSKAFLSFETVGGDFATSRTVVDNAFLTEKQQYLNQPSLKWLLLSTMPHLRERRVYLELATKTSNPNFPPRVGLGGACSEAQAAEPQSWFGVSRVFAHDVAASPADELARFASMFAEEPPADLNQAARRYAAWLSHSLGRWSADKATADDVQLINWLLEQALVSNSSAAPEIAALVNRYREREQALPTPRTVNGMSDVDPPHEYRLNIRGDYDELGDPIPRGYLRMLAGASQTISTGSSGRRELAEWVASPSNPLTARVFVNRAWHWLFGSGLVRTMDDFGHLGERPSHPELLDNLARRFMIEGWSVKRLVREIVLTETWRQSNVVAEQARQVDPDNRLLHHYPLQRLDAESIRDAMLCASGRLDSQVFGPTIDPHRANEDPQKRLYSGPVDSLGRRSIYIKMTIMEPPKFLAAFNQPSPKIPTGRRDVTNTPSQSLALLNDPLVSALADHWAGRLLADSHATVPERLTAMFESALSRPPTEEESNRWSQAVVDFTSLRGVAADQALSNRAVWTDVAHAILNLKEFIDIR